MNEFVLPWTSGRRFQLWRYGVGHSQLLLRSPAEGEGSALGILFEAVEFMHLRKSYRDLVLRLPHDGEGQVFDAVRALPIPQLRVALEGRGSVGFVSCSRVTVRRIDDGEGDSWADGIVLFSLTPASLPD